ncbi:uncharacterized protein ARMOST_21414 [Armillaria ostoyae]|uniref:Uncharacterized protein n=1 Tax=Armillaria ostoyae TaxID=47428 RepID=A0A284SA08_ARMOS|nr:uncharacterized protein ARMOST_21414 [Armillaria ostoyae]
MGCFSSKYTIDLPSQPPHDPLQTRSQDPPRQHHHDPQLTRRLQDTPSSPTPSLGPVSEPNVPPPYSALPFQDPQQTPDSQTQTLSIQYRQTPMPIPTTPPPHRSISLTIPMTPPTVTESPRLLGSSTISPPVDLTGSHSTSTSQTPDPTMNPPTLAISLPQAPGNPVRDERGRSVVQALKATLHLMCTTLEKAPLPIPRVQDFLRVNLDVMDVIEISSDEYGFQDIHDLMEEINAQFVVLTKHYSTSEELQRKIDSIARSANELVPTLSKLVKGRSLENSRSAGDDRILVADFLRRIKEELDSRANDAADRAGSTAPEVRVTLKHVEGGVSVRIDMQSGSRDALSSMTIGSTVPRPPSPSFLEDAKRVSLPHTIPPFERFPPAVGTTFLPQLGRRILRWKLGPTHYLTLPSSSKTVLGRG